MSQIKKHELSNALKTCYLGDQVYIKDAVDTHSRLTKIVEINKDTIKVAFNDLIFSKHSLQCITRGYNYYFITDVVTMLFPRLYNVIKKEYKVTEQKDNHVVFSFNYVKASFVDIKLYRNSNNFKDACAFVVIANGHLICSCDLFTIEDYHVIYKCFLSKFNKTVKPNI